jgi:hypothetical protein
LTDYPRELELKKRWGKHVTNYVTID